MAELNQTDRMQNLLTDMDRPNSLPLFQAGVNFNNGKPSFSASSPLMDMMPRRETLGSGVMSDREADMVMNAMPSNPMQPLVEMGFGDQVEVILGNPADSDISRQAQQQIINEMGTGMDIDSFLMEVNNLAPKGAMTNINAEGIQQLMSMGRDGDTTIGHLSEGEVVIPAPVLEANPQAADMLEETMSQMGIDPRTRVVDSTGEIGGIAAINPDTNMQEFGFLSDVWKKAKKVVKKAAPILPFIPGIGPALSGIAGAAGTAITTGLSSIPVIGGALSSGASAIGNLATSGVSGIQSLLGRSADYDPVTGSGQSAVGRIEDFLKGEQREEYSEAEIDEMLETMDPSIVEGIVKKGKITYRSDRQQPKTLDDQVGMGMMGKMGIAGLAGLIGKLAYDEAKDQKGVPLTPLTQMDQLGRYNIEAEIARRTGEKMPSRVEFGLNPEGMPALSGGRPTVTEGMVYQPPEKRMMASGGIMAFANGGSVAMAEGGDPMIDISPENFPMKDGQIDGPGTETSDDIPAMLSDGEFVMTSKAVRGAGSFDVSDNNGILTLTPNGTPTRDSGTRVMYKLMEHFGSAA